MPDIISAAELDELEDWLMVERPMKASTAKKRRSLLVHAASEYGFDWHEFQSSLEGAERQKRSLLAKLRRQNAPGTTLQNYARLIKGLAHHAGFQKDLEVRMPAAEEAEPKAYNEDEWASIRGFRLPRNRLMEAQLRALMDVAYYTAMRPGELARLERRDLDPARSRVYVRYPEKGGWRRWLPVEREMWSPKRSLSRWQRVLDGLEVPDPARMWWSFKYHRGRPLRPWRPASADTFRNWMNRWVQPATMVDVEMHRFRHTRAVALKVAGHDVVFIKEFLGHRKLETTWNYLRSLMGGLLETFNAARMPGIQGAASRHRRTTK